MSRQSDTTFIKFEISRKIAVQIFIALGIIILISVSSFRSLQNLLNSSQAIIDHSDNISRAQEMVNILFRLEVGQKGFVITGDESFFAQSEELINQLNRILKDVRISAEKYPSLVSISSLDASVQNRLNLMHQSVSYRRTSGFEAARKFFLTQKGRKSSEVVWNLLEDMQDRETIELKRAIKDQREKERITQMTVLAESFAAFLLILFASLRVNSDLLVARSPRGDSGEMRQPLKSRSRK